MKPKHIEKIHIAARALEQAVSKQLGPSQFPDSDDLWANAVNKIITAVVNELHVELVRSKDIDDCCGYDEDDNAANK